jgi:ABC-type transport system involved in multi-copper enzyme maturation permease subunit
LFYIRLAIFFGCVGVFMNLFRGELIDKSLHFYLLAPIRREVLLAAKYGAGLLATAVIFGLSTVVQLYAVYGDMPAAQATEFWARDGAGTLFAYFGVTILACAGYGAVFLAAGLLYKNPMIPAAVLLVWEGANVFLPATLKKISVIHYLQSLCPIPASPSGDISPPLRLLISITEPTPAPLAILGLLTVTLVVLALGAWQARRLEINYSAE